MRSDRVSKSPEGLSPAGVSLPGIDRRAGGCLLLSLLLLEPSRAFAYVPLRFVSPFLRPSTWPTARIPLSTMIHSAGSADVPGNADILAIQTAQQSWNSQNTSYFSFAPPTTSASAVVNDGDGINCILWDETGSFFAPGDTTLSATVIRVDLATGEMRDADTVFNGVANTWSTANPTPAGQFDIQTAATHEMGHVAGLDHDAVLGASLYPFAPSASQAERALASDDRRGLTFLYPETLGQLDFQAPATGEGDLALATGSIAGQVLTQGGAGVHGAQVSALETHGGLVAAALTAPDGTYTLTGLPAGVYQVLANALDGAVQEQDLANGGADNFLTGFPMLFLGGNAVPQGVSVTEGSQATGANFALSLPEVFEVEPNNAAASAQPIVPGASVSGTLAGAQDADYYSFPVAAGDIVLLDVQSGGDGNPLDPVLTLFDPSGMLPLVSVDDTTGKGLDPRIGRQFTSAGTYFARVTDAFSQGGPGYAYTFAVEPCLSEMEPNGTSLSARDLSYGERRGGLVDGGGDADWYRFSGRAGDRLHAEVTANRSGSPLDPRFTLVGPDGVTLLASAADTYGKDPGLDFTLPASPATANYFLKVESQSGAGAGAWYCLALDRISMSVSATARVPLGTGVSGAVTDPFPRVAQPGESFDLVLAGPSLAPDATARVTGAGVTLTSTTGPPYALDAQGRGVKAFSVFISPAALPGLRTVVVEDGRGGAAALPGGLALWATSAPGEAAVGGGSAGLHWIAGELSWAPVAGSSGYDLYRGNLTDLVDTDGNGVADSYGGLLACNLSEPVAVDAAIPSPGSGFFYLVTAVNALGQGPLGYAFNGLPRPLASLSPVCP